MVLRRSADLAASDPSYRLGKKDTKATMDAIFLFEKCKEHGLQIGDVKMVACCGNMLLKVHMLWTSADPHREINQDSDEHDTEIISIQPTKDGFRVYPSSDRSSSSKAQPASDKAQPASDKAQPASGKAQPQAASSKSQFTFGALQSAFGKAQPASGKAQPASGKSSVTFQTSDPPQRGGTFRARPDLFVITSSGCPFARKLRALISMMDQKGSISDRYQIIIRDVGDQGVRAMMKEQGNHDGSVPMMYRTDNNSTVIGLISQAELAEFLDL